MNINSKFESTHKSTKRTLNSLIRRRSLKSLRAAKNYLQKTSIGKHQYIGDRFIAHRDATNFDNIDLMLNKTIEIDDNSNRDDLSVPNLINAVFKPQKKRILKMTINQMSPSVEQKFQSLLQKRYSRPKFTRQISIHPERVLDAPDLLYEYSNILDWGENNFVAVALDNAVYLWQASTGVSEELMRYTNNTTECISSLKWIKSATFKNADMLAIGSNLGNVLVWDTNKKRVIRKISLENESEIISISSKSHLLSLGLKSGLIQHHDLRYEASLMFSNSYNKNTIRYLKWSYDQQNLGAVAQNSCLSIWTVNNLDSMEPSVLVREAVKDFVWNPNDYNILLYSINQTGLVKLFDILKKTCIKSVNIDGIVECLYWSEGFNEIAMATSDQNDMCSIKIVHDHHLSTMFTLTGHRQQIITMVANPTGEIIASVAHDEQIRLWNCFKSSDCRKLKSKRNQNSDFLNEIKRFR